jgi:hypothetical protein
VAPTLHRPMVGARGGGRVLPVLLLVQNTLLRRRHLPICCRDAGCVTRLKAPAANSLRRRPNHPARASPHWSRQRRRVISRGRLPSCWAQQTSPAPVRRPSKRFGPTGRAPPAGPEFGFPGVAEAGRPAVGRRAPQHPRAAEPRHSTRLHGIAQRASSERAPAVGPAGRGQRPRRGVSSGSRGRLGTGPTRARLAGAPHGGLTRPRCWLHRSSPHL